MNHETFMARCLGLASQGCYHTMANPMVGALLLRNGKIIAEGYHKKYGTAHAEVQALIGFDKTQIQDNDVLYVSLEPCSHHGKTPPCVDLIINLGIKKVVVGTLDPNPIVAGKGIKKMRDAGIEVQIGVLENECRELNKAFFTFHEKERPYIILKWAESRDGFIDPMRGHEEKGSINITHVLSRQAVHQLRARTMGIVIGRNTWLIDDPKLDVRMWFGNNPQKFLLSKLNMDDQRLIKSFPNIDFLLQYCVEHKIQSLLIEGGTYTLQQFINQQLYDEVWVFQGKIKLKQGLLAPILPGGLALNKQEFSWGDTLYVHRR